MNRLLISQEDIIDEIKYQLDESEYFSYNISTVAYINKYEIYAKVGECLDAGFKILLNNMRNLGTLYKFLIKHHENIDYLSLKRKEQKDELYKKYVSIHKYISIIYLAHDDDDSSDDEYIEWNMKHRQHVDSTYSIIYGAYIKLLKLHNANTKIIKRILQKRICKDCVGKIMSFIV